MTRYCSAVVVGGIAVACWPGVCMGEIYGAAGPGVPGLGGVSIATSADPSDEGYLGITPDAFGSWASVGFGGGGDIFNPLGGNGPLETVFTSGFFLFGSGPAFGQRVLLTTSNDWLALASDGSLDAMITGAPVGSDSSGNGVMDTLTSSFSVFGPEAVLDFNVTQQVFAGDVVSFLRQDYVITNSGVDVSFDLVRALDADMLWSGDFADDEVGTGANGGGVGTYVYQQEVGDPSTAIALSSPQADAYYGGKNGVLPPTPPGGPAYGYGTDVQVWESFGTPTNWINHIAGVGYDTDGSSGAFPPGAGATPDGFVGLNIPVDLAPGASTTVSVFYTYGSNLPVPEPGTLALLGFGGFCLLRRRL